MKLKRVARNLNRNGWRRLEGTRLEAMVISQLVSASNRREVYDSLQREDLEHRGGADGVRLG